MTGLKPWKTFLRKNFILPWLRDDCVEKTELKFSNQLGDAYFHIIHKYGSCCLEVFYRVFVLKILGNS